MSRYGRIRGRGRETCAGAVAAMLLAVVLSVSGCDNARSFRGFDLAECADAQLIAVPPVTVAGAQGCGYAALSSVALYHRVGAAALLAPPVKEKFGGRALSARDLVEMAKAVGLDAFAYEGSMEDLESSLGKGRPVILMLDGPPRVSRSPSFSWAFETAKAIVGRAHWVVAVGVGPGADVVLQDPLSGYVVMARQSLDRTWGKRSRVCVLVTRRGNGAKPPDSR